MYIAFSFSITITEIYLVFCRKTGQVFGMMQETMDRYLLYQWYIAKVFGAGMVEHINKLTLQFSDFLGNLSVPLNLLF